MREIAFFGEKRAIKKWLPKEILYSVAKADHIVTVSENTKRDIIELLCVDEKGITNTYQAVSFPKEDIEHSEIAIAEQLVDKSDVCYPSQRDETPRKSSNAEGTSV